MARAVQSEKQARRALWRMVKPLSHKKEVSVSNIVGAMPTELSYQQQSALPTRKVAAGSATAAVSTVVVWVINTYKLLPGGQQVPADVALAVTTLLSFLASYLTRPSAADQIVRRASM